MADNDQKIVEPVVVTKEKQSHEEPRSDAEKTLHGIWKSLLGKSKISIHDDFYDLGGDSLLGVKMLSIAQRKGLLISPKMFQVFRTIATLSEHTHEITDKDQEDYVGEVPLLPYQVRFLERLKTIGDEEQLIEVMGVGYELDADTSESALKGTIDVLIDRHPMLRSRFEFKDGDWKHIINKNAHDQFLSFDLSDFSNDELVNKESEILFNCRHFDIEKDPLFRAVFLKQKEGSNAKFYVIGHRLVMDLASRAIILNDIQLAFRFIEKKLPVPFPPKTTSYLKWGQWVLEHVESAGIEFEREYWNGLLGDKIPKLPTKTIATSNGGQNFTSVSSVLDSEYTIELMKIVNTVVPSQYFTDIYDILYTALAIAYSEWTNNLTLGVDVLGHGREDWKNNFDLSRTIGRFSVVYPMRLHIDESATLDATLEKVSAQVKQVPNRGFSYGLLRYLSSNKNVEYDLSKFDTSEIYFHYRGNFELTNRPDHRWKPISGRPWSAPLVSFNGSQAYALTIQSYIANKKLRVGCRFDANLLEKADIQKFADRFIETIQKIVVDDIVKVRTGIKEMHLPK